MWIYIPFFLIWRGYELPETQNRRITRWPTRIHGILPCYPSHLGTNFQDVFWTSWSGLYRRYNHNWSVFTRFETCLCIHIDTTIAKDILQKGTRGSFHNWVRDDYDLAVTMLQKPHALGGFGLTPNVLAQISDKVVTASRFLKLVGSLPL
jgi:hypothetical protein